jgi:septal ring factor EnvC (AmiA/AmiB activator)
MQNGMPGLEQIQCELQRLVKNSALSKANFRAKLGKLSQDVTEANQTVLSLEEQLEAARAKQALAQKAIEAAKQRREKESGRIQVRKLHLQIMMRCLDEPDLLAELDQVVKREDDPRKYERLSGYEMAVMRQRLEEIQDLLTQAETLQASNVHETSNKGASMKHEAMKTYILYHKYNQV